MKALQLVFFSWTLLREYRDREVSRATGRRWEDGGEIRGAVIYVFIENMSSGGTP